MAAKRHYRRQDELRALLIDEGVRLLLESNPGDRDVVTFTRVFDRVEQAGHARVTKGSVLGPGRVWSSQQEFQRDVEVATAAVVGNIDGEMSATLVAAAGVLDQLDLRTKAGRARGVQQLCRVAGEAYFTELLESKTWRLWIGLWGRMASTVADGADGEGLGASLRQAQEGTLDQLVEKLYAPLAELVGLQGRSEYGSTEGALAHLAIAIVGVTDGLAIHHRLFPEHFAPIGRPTGPNGEIEQWHPFANTLEALINRFLEPAPGRR